MLINRHKSIARSKYGLWRMIYILVFGLLFFSICLTGYFIYHTIYVGIADANTIVATNLATNTYSLDISSFEKSVSAIEQKKQVAPFPNDARNIFEYAQPQNTPTSTASSTI